MQRRCRGQRRRCRGGAQVQSCAELLRRVEQMCRGRGAGAEEMQVQTRCRGASAEEVQVQTRCRGAEVHRCTGAQVQTRYRRGGDRNIIDGGIIICARMFGWYGRFLFICVSSRGRPQERRHKSNQIAVFPHE